MPAETMTPVALSERYVLFLSVLATAGLVIMWGVFWWRVPQEKAYEVLLEPAFFRTVSVMGVISAAVVLSLAGRLDGHITGAILSGIVGYVLGQLTTRSQSRSEKASATSAIANQS